MKRRVPTSAELPPPIREGLSRLAADAVPGPFGRKPFRELVTDHHEVFTELRRLPRSKWKRIVKLLEDWDIVDKDQLGEAVLRATYSEVSRAASANPAHRDEVQQAETQRNPAKRAGANRQLDATGTNDARPAEPQRIAADRNVTHRSAADGNETELALHRRAALLNRQNGRR